MDLIIILFISILIIVGFWLWFRRRAQHKIDEYKQQNAYKAEEYYKWINQKQLDEFDEVRAQYEEEKAQLQSELTSLNQEIKKSSQFNQELIDSRSFAIDQMMKARQESAERLFNAQVLQRDKELKEWAQSAQEAANFKAAQERKLIEKETQQKIDELDAYRAKVDAANKEILRRRALEEKQEFYSIQISESTKRDINYLLSIVDNFNNKEAIYKLIWSEYIQAPFKSMLNRVLQNRDPRNVIYMIQNFETKEIYIGKTKAEVSKRWTEHIKTSLNIGAISRTKIHTSLFNHWDKFVFSILEEVPDNANLNEREKYYINFYQSDIYGYNIKSGG